MCAVRNYNVVICTQFLDGELCSYFVTTNDPDEVGTKLWADDDAVSGDRREALSLLAHIVQELLEDQIEEESSVYAQG